MNLSLEGPYPKFFNFIESISSCDPIKHFPLSKIVKHFGADSGSYWLRDVTDIKELVLIDTVNRPDLDAVADKISISTESSNFHIAMHKKNYDHFLYADCGDPALTLWQNELREIGLTPQSGAILFLPFVPKGQKAAAGAVILHSQSGFKSRVLEINQITHLVRTVANVIDVALDGHKLMLRERHKIGHEVKRQIKDAKNRVSEIQTVIEKRTSMNSSDAIRTLDDAISGLTAAGKTVEKGTFTEAVSARAKTCRHVDFRKIFLQTSHLALADYPIKNVLFNSLLAPERLSVKIDQVDLSLVLSNLISNAAKYSVQRGDITCRWNTKEDRHTLTISNNSEVLDEQQLEMMWRFGHRGPNSTDIEGEGVGLSVVSDICDIYGLKPYSAQSVSDANTRTNIRIDFPKLMART